MHANEKLINEFYGAFQRGDGETMVGCYHADGTFSDPVFPNLSVSEAGAMWRTFCSGEVEVEFSGVSCTESEGCGHWGGSAA